MTLGNLARVALLTALWVTPAMAQTPAPKPKQVRTERTVRPDKVPGARGAQRPGLKGANAKRRPGTSAARIEQVKARADKRFQTLLDEAKAAHTAGDTPKALKLRKQAAAVRKASKARVKMLREKPGVRRGPRATKARRGKRNIRRPMVPAKAANRPILIKEWRKHAKRMARITRLIGLARTSGDADLLRRASILRGAEGRRHRAALKRLRGQK